MLLEDLTWPTIASLSKDTPVLVPIAALEQHGQHLPLMTDSMLLREIVRRIEAERTTQLLITPLMWLGNSDHHLDFPGTLSCPSRVYLDLLNGLVDNLMAHGFKRILMLNGHGGNDVPGKQALFEARQRSRSRNDLLLLLATYWSLGADPRQGMPDLHQSEMGHACEWETSMILRIAPHLVGDYRAAIPVEPGRPFTPASRAWITTDRSIPGHIGSPHLATADKGEHLFATFSQDCNQLIQRMVNWNGTSWDG